MTYGMSQGSAEWWWKIFRAKPIRRQSTNTPLWLFKLNKAWSAAVCLPFVLVTCISDSRKTHRRPHAQWYKLPTGCSLYDPPTDILRPGLIVSVARLSHDHRGWLLVSGTRFITDLLLGLLLFRLFLIFCFRAFIFLGGHPFTLAWSLITSRFH